MPNELIPKESIQEILNHRERALEEFKIGLRHLLAASKAGKRATKNDLGLNIVRHRYVSLKDLDPETFRHEIDRGIWRYLIEASGIRAMMGSKDVKKWNEQLQGENVPEATWETIAATMTALASSVPDLIETTTVSCYERLSRDHKTNHPEALTKRIIYKYAYNPQWPSVNRHDGIGLLLHDLERLMLIFDGKPASEDCRIVGLLDEVMPKYGRPKRRPPWTAETEYFQIKAFKKGTIHVYFKRDDLLARLNLVLAKHYGKTLPESKESWKK